MLELVFDLKGFSIILVTCLFAFTSTFFILYNGKISLSDAIMQQYRLTLGEFEEIENDQSLSQRILFCITSFFMTVLMLNLVIAIMGDTYSRVMTRIVETDGKQLNALILQQECFQFWNREKGKSMFLFKISQGQNQEKEWLSGADYITNSLQEPQREIKNEISSLKQEIKDNKESQKQLEKQIQIKFDEVKKRQECNLIEIKSEIQNQFLKIKDELFQQEQRMAQNKKENNLINN